MRPLRAEHKPIMAGAQTAVVVGPAGEEIWTDNLGRVRVQIDWDRQGRHDEKATCWMRGAQAWAGDKRGAIHIPRIAQDVVVGFFDGEPDRPVVSGTAYSRDNLAPYQLPDRQTQSGVRTRSSKGGTAGNFNEIRFEDKEGQEALRVQAEKDMSTLVDTTDSRSNRAGASRGPRPQRTTRVVG